MDPKNMTQAQRQALWSAAGHSGIAPVGYGGESGGGGSGAASQYVGSIANQFTQLKPFDQVDPFSFDKALATQAATAEYEPYYNQLLSDYTKQVNTTISRSQEDLKSTLTSLQQGKDYYTGTQGRLLDKALKSTNEGYAGRGLFFSGAREKDINDLNTQYQADSGNYNNQYDYNVGQAKTGQARSVEDTNTALSQYQRDITQQKKTGIAQGVLNRQSEAQQMYETARSAYYGSSALGQDASNKAIANLPKYSYT